MDDLQAVDGLLLAVDEVLHPVDGHAVQAGQVLGAVLQSIRSAPGAGTYHGEEEVDLVLRLVLGSDGLDVHLLHLVLGDLFSGHGVFGRVG